MSTLQEVNRSTKETAMDGYTVVELEFDEIIVLE